MKKAKVALLLLLSFCMVVMLLTGCQGKTADPGDNATESSKPSEKQSDTAESEKEKLPVIGHAFKYDPNEEVIGGREAKFEFWYHSEVHEPILKKWTEEYSKLHPNISASFLLVGGSEYIPKLTDALQSGTGPDLFWHGNGNDDIFLPYAMSYNDAGLDIEGLKQDFINTDIHTKPDGKIYYLDLGIMTAGIYYNKAMFREAGITEIPKSWDQFVDTAKRLTKYDDKGNIVVQGFALKGQENPLWMSKMYTKGSFLFNEDSTPRLNTPESIESLKEIWDCYYTHKISDLSFENFNVAFGNEQGAMMYSWAWVDGYLMTNFPDLEFGFFALPTVDGNIPPAYDRQNTECTFVLNKAHRGDRTEAAIDFLKYFIANDEAMLDADLKLGIAPGKKSLFTRPELLQSETIKVEIEMIPRTIFPGTAPNAYYEGTGRFINQEIFENNTPIEEAMRMAQEQITKDMANTGFQQIERKYQFANELR